MSAIHTTEPAGSMSITSPSPWQSALVGCSAWFQRAARAAGSVILGMIFENNMRRAARELRRLDDRTLRDIGLTRTEIDSLVRYGRAADLAQVRKVFGSDSKSFT